MYRPSHQKYIFTEELIQSGYLCERKVVVMECFVKSIMRVMVICLVLAGKDACTEPKAVVDSFQHRTASLTSFTASIERVQTYRDARRVGRGTVVFDKVQGCAYTYREPGRYCFICNDSIVCGIDLRKQAGWRSRVGAEITLSLMKLRERIDPLHRFFQLVSIDKKTLTYRGNSGELLLFAMPLQGGMRRMLGFDAVSYQCRIVETFDSAGRILEKTVFSYGKKSQYPFPSVMVISEPAGDYLSVDSIVFGRIRINGVVSPDVFVVPDKVRWGIGGVLSTPFR